MSLTWGHHAKLSNLELVCPGLNSVHVTSSHVEFALHAQNYGHLQPDILHSVRLFCVHLFFNAFKDFILRQLQFPKGAAKMCINLFIYFFLLQDSQDLENTVSTY